LFSEIYSLLRIEVGDLNLDPFTTFKL